MIPYYSQYVPLEVYLSYLWSPARRALLENSLLSKLARKHAKQKKSKKHQYLAFNEGNRTQMCWTIRHLWPAGARYVFNCYRHWAVLVVRAGNGNTTFLFSKEGVTQGDPLSMVAYGLSLLPLICPTSFSLDMLMTPEVGETSAKYVRTFYV